MPDTRTRRARRDRGSLVASLVGAAVVVLANAAGALAVWAARSELPGRVATHWGADGRADQLTAVADLYGPGLLLGAGVGLLLVATGFVTGQGRLLGPIGAATGIFISGVTWGTVLAQRGLTAEQVDLSSPFTVLWISAAVALVVGFGLGRLFRRRHIESPVEVRVGETAPRLLVDDRVTLAWTGRTRVSPGVWGIVAVSGLAVAVPMVLGLLNGSPEMAITMAVVLLVVLVLVGSLSAGVVIDARGVRIRGLGIIPWVSADLAEIAGAEVTEVNPFRQFGGWGLRIDVDGTTAFVTARGPAVRMDRGDRGDLVITLTDAESAAATINTLVARRGHSAR